MEVDLFRSRTDAIINVIPETEFIGKLGHRIRDLVQKAPQIVKPNWYLQQFIKLSVLKQAAYGDNYLIWDADTIPLKSIEFFHENDFVSFYTSKERHNGYFALNDKIFGEKIRNNFSFIAQSFPCKIAWSKSFFKFIENKFGIPWYEALLNSIDFRNSNGFSEYEILGNYIYKMFNDKIIFKDSEWLRNGSGLVGGVSNLNVEPFKSILEPYDHVTFEKWEQPFKLLKVNGDKKVEKLLSTASLWKPTIQEFLDALFGEGLVKKLSQIGAADGIVDDPVRRFLKNEENIDIVFIEPRPDLCTNLRELYRNSENVRVVEIAVGAQSGLSKLYYLPDNLTSEMNGNINPNDWARGQGTQDKHFLIKEINFNAFRGIKYRMNIKKYINSINSINIQVIKTSEVIPKVSQGHLLIIDVQGAELDVLEGIDWTSPPQWIVVENNFPSMLTLIEYFTPLGYKYIAGGGRSKDMVFSKSFAPFDPIRIGNFSKVNLRTSPPKFWYLLPRFIRIWIKEIYRKIF
jgi:FkbM family methyltransferase